MKVFNDNIRNSRNKKPPNFFRGFVSFALRAQSSEESGAGRRSSPRSIDVLHEDDVIEEFRTEEVIHNAVTCEHTNARLEVILSDGPLNHQRNVWTVDNTRRVVFRSLEGQEDVLWALCAETILVLTFGTGVTIDREAATERTNLGNTDSFSLHCAFGANPLEVRKGFENGTNRWGRDDDVGRTHAITNGEAVGFDNDVHIEGASAFHLPAAIRQGGIPCGPAMTLTTLNSSLHHAHDHFAVNFGLDFIAHHVGEFAIDVDTAHVLEVLLKFDRPGSCELTCTSFNGSLFKLDGQLGKFARVFEVGDRGSDTLIEFGEDIFSIGVRNVRESCAFLTREAGVEALVTKFGVKLHLSAT